MNPLIQKERDLSHELTAYFAAEVCGMNNLPPGVHPFAYDPPQYLNTEGEEWHCDGCGKEFEMEWDENENGYEEIYPVIPIENERGNFCCIECAEPEEE